MAVHHRWQTPERSEDERPLGVPGIPPAGGAAAPQVQPVATAPVATAASAASAPVPAPPPRDEYGGRPGDSGLGVPAAVAREARILTDEEIARLEAEEERLAKEDAERLLRELDRKFYGFVWPTWLRTPLVLAALALVGLFGMFLVSQVVATLASVEALPEWSRYVVLGALGLFALLVVYVLLRLLRFLVVLRQNKQVRIAALMELQRRQGWHTMQLARLKLNEAQRDLREYLRTFPLEPKQAEALQRAGMTAEEIARLQAERERLLDPNLDPGAEAWITDFQQRFQAVIDAAADRRIQAASLRGGVLTAAAPYPVFDMAIVLWTGFQTVGDLCALYNLKAGRFQNAMVLAKVIVTAYIAGNLQTLTHDAAAAIGRDEVMQEQLGRLGANLFGGAIARVGEGTVNALLLRRLGRTTRYLLQPVASGRRGR